MPPVAGIGQDRRRPAQPVEVVANGVRHVEGGGLLRIRRADTRQANRVNVNEQPAAARNVRVASQVPVLGNLDAVRALGQDFRAKWVQREVDAAGRVGQAQGLGRHLV